MLEGAIVESICLACVFVAAEIISVVERRPGLYECAHAVREGGIVASAELARTIETYWYGMRRLLLA